MERIRSHETLETFIMIVLVGFMLFVLRNHPISLYSWILLAFLVGIMIFGLMETIPYFLMYFRPYQSRAFRMDVDQAEKEKICRELDRSYGKPGYLELPDLEADDKYLILLGKRNMEVMRWEDIVSVDKKEYPFRQKYKGTFLLYFTDRSGIRHELDIHNGKNFNPVRQVSRIFVHIRDAHPGIRLELSDIDQERIDQMQEEERRIRKPGLLWEEQK